MHFVLNLVDLSFCGGDLTVGMEIRAFGLKW